MAVGQVQVQTAEGALHFGLGHRSDYLPSRDSFQHSSQRHNNNIDMYDEYDQHSQDTSMI
jgi:hypothetical protein